MRLMLDTNICIYLIKQKPPQVFARFREHQIGDIGISSITVAELQYGVRKSQQQARNQAALDQFLLPLVVVDFDQAAAAAYGELRASLEGRGWSPGPSDMLIAAHALSRQLVLITNHVAEFSQVDGLIVESWAV